ncbi:YcnI family copper-binding membrane protein [Nonomuraea gerenzanensis]|uniref:Conserved membrane protein in copper uptake, YcnI n=1 Tax=Nonomuraea gerenzanensis TaxID=93944 RepID=A0A1M4E8G0_9ACTN|nr:YcnI family protein [Nonomuraea gerenzanensis]UBU17356.1 YcnI family protein [Nonomuraea gerenzanensis]SBO95106.1 Conserved membrane protein in copper uptake, YcnI [Nonomuraea gerenzanensis]
MSFVRRAVTVLAATTALTAGLALPALAHVTIQPGTAEQGGFTKVAFRVPNERDNASTTKIEVSFPTDHPLAFVSVKPVPGWKVKVTESKLPKPVKTEYGDLEEAVTKVVWEGGKINPGEFQEFEVSMGQLPEDVDSLMFPTKQTYSGGEVVDWAEAPKADGTEPEHPAPLLKLVPAAEDASTATLSATAPATAPASASASPSVAVAAASSSDGTARLLGAAGLVVGVIGVVIGFLGLRRRPSA